MQENIDEKTKVLIVGVNVNNREFFKESMEELVSLVEACNMEVCGRVEQNLKAINKPLYIGTGKVEEVKETKVSEKKIATKKSSAKKGTSKTKNAKK